MALRCLRQSAATWLGKVFRNSELHKRTERHSRSLFCPGIQHFSTFLSYCETYDFARDMLWLVRGRFEGRLHEHYLLLFACSEKIHVCTCHGPSVAHLSIVRVPCTSGRQYVCVKANMCVCGLGCQNPVRVPRKGGAAVVTTVSQKQYLDEISFFKVILATSIRGNL